MSGLSWPGLPVRFGSSPVPLRSARIPLILWKFLPSHRETGHQSEARLQTRRVSLCSGVARRVAGKKVAEKGKNKLFKAQRLFGGKWDSGRAMLHWSLVLEIQMLKVFYDAWVTSPPPGTAWGEPNTLVRFCLIVKTTEPDVDNCCELEHQDFIVSIYLAGGGMPQTELMLLITCLSSKEYKLFKLVGLIWATERETRGKGKRQRWWGRIKKKLEVKVANGRK